MKWIAWLAVLTGIFSFGAAAGLFVSAWLKNNPHYGDKTTAVIPGVDIPARVTVPSGERERPETSGESPARESPPSAMELQAELPPSSGRQGVRIAPPVVESGQSAKEPHATQEASVHRVAPPVAQPEPAQQEVAKQEASPLPPPQQDAPAETPPTQSSAIANEQDSNRNAPVTDATASVPLKAVTPPPPAPATKSAKARSRPKVAKKVAPAPNHEIERIKRQAGDELMKKTANRIARERVKNVRQLDPVKPANSHVSRRALLVQCEQAPNLFQRERCKWKLCNGLWGKDGCPSYETHREM